ncbi:DUF3034 family protein [Burkholderia sp. Bp9012]|uniref:DUF3034 family protein n=1 Tax=Burkholderia sp. Bp9012 TaxID=2184562 RepID=UPI000F5A32CE|nr:DUF3034 family protein [Burkholderia sp. Bp9012]RQR85347.1 DUF3034 family protein [Burkholderia sp. Bp9012]
MKKSTPRVLTVVHGLIVAAGLLSCEIAHAGWFDFNTGKVLATGGVSMVDGAGGGGITPWATITGYETRDGINGDVHYTYVNLPNYTLHSVGAAVGLWDRVELSYANDSLPTGSTFDTVGLVTDGVLGLNTGIKPWNTTIGMNVFGMKVRLFGEAIYDSDNLIPQVALGAFYKRNNNPTLIKTLGAAKASDWEAYLAMTKIFFPLSTLVNVTLRYSAANQTGLVGFGGPNGDKKTIRPEVSVAYLLNKGTAIGAEYQKHGNNLTGQSVNLAGLNLTGLTNLLGGSLGTTLTQSESDWKDVFVAFFPNKNLSITLAYAMLGQITLTPHQNGFYASVQASF